MYCKNCGNPVDENARFCEHCGAFLSAAPAAETPHGENTLAFPKNAPLTVTDRVVRGEDGVYRWRYDVNLFTNPMFLWLVWKIFFCILLVGFAIMCVIDMIDSFSFFKEQLPETLKMFGIFTAGMTVLVLLGYLLYAAIMGGKYSVIFEMNEQGVNHKQIPAQAKKAKKIAAATAVAGMAAGKIGTVGVGLNASRTEMYSDFQKVRKVKAQPGLHVIKVNNRFNHNQVYAKSEDFDFVYNYIVSHCPNQK